jgi:EmrB/QacA subfamily drug resistance transporter
LSQGGQTGTEDLPRWTILSVTTLGAFMAALDSNIVTIALPYIAKGLSAGYSLLGWVLAGYVLAVAALVLQAGKLGDAYGKKRVYLIGFAVFGASSALCGVSENAYQLIAFRLVQGAGASVMIATAIPLIFASFPPSQRGSAVGINSIAWAVGAVAGPVLGGVLTAIDWRLIFYVNVPVAALAVLIGRAKIPVWLNVKNVRGGKINLPNALVLGTAIALVMLWLTAVQYWLAALGVLGVIAFVVAELKSSNPLLNRELLESRGFVYSVISLGVMMTAFFGIAFVMSFYFQSVAGLSPLAAGLWLAPLPVALAISNPIAGKVFDKLRRPAAVSVAGAVVVFLSLLGLSRELAAAGPGVEVAALLAVTGAAGGFVWAPSISSALKFSRAEMRGVANGTAFTLIYLGFATSVALVVSVSTAALPAGLAAQVQSGSVILAGSSAALFDGGLANALLALAAVGAMGVPFLLLVLREQSRHFRTYAEVPYEEPLPSAQA